QARRNRAIEGRNPVMTLLERPGDADLGALVALTADHERDPAGTVEDPHPLVDRPRQRHQAVHLDEVVVGQADRRCKLRDAGLGGGGFGHQKLIERPSTASAASPSTSLRVGCGCVEAPISHGVASSWNPSEASAMRSVAWG